MNVFYSADYVRAGYAFDTTRKAAWIAESLSTRPLATVDVLRPEPVTAAQLGDVHQPTYVESIRTGEPRDLAESQGFTWDLQLWPSVCASTGGVLAAARTALDEGVAGSFSSGLHHAKFARGAGFCTFNGLALAAHDALGRGARAVLILDLDAHCGGGTHALVQKEPRVWQADVAVALFDQYTPAGHHRLRVVAEAADYLPTIRTVLAEVAQAWAWGEADVCLYNAGMDPHEDCAVGGLPGITSAVLAEREQLVFEWCRAHRLPVAFVMAGGYVSDQLSQDELVALHRLTIEAAAAAAAQGR